MAGKHQVKPKSSLKRVQALRKRRAALGQKRREYYLTDEEKKELDDCLKLYRMQHFVLPTEFQKGDVLAVLRNTDPYLQTR